MEGDRTPDDSQVNTTPVRPLTEEEVDKLARDTKVISAFKQQKLEEEAKKNWDLFYKRNTTKFFKDRHWTTREFTELCGSQTGSNDPLTVLEVGCGVGNFIYPLLTDVPNIYFHASDFSPRAVQFVKDHCNYDENRVHAFQNDLTKDPLTNDITPETVDIVSMIFVLSAIHPDKMVQALENVNSVLRPGGSVLVRDYGLHDHAMLRFAPGHKLMENFYVRQDGTRAFYFSNERLSSVFHAAGFTTTSVEYILRDTVNKKQDLCVPRVFVQGKFTKTGTRNIHQSEDTSTRTSLTDEGNVSPSKMDSHLLYNVNETNAENAQCQ